MEKIIFYLMMIGWVKQWRNETETLQEETDLRKKERTRKQLLGLVS